MELLSSGAFQARTRLSAKALRLYAVKGLLVPAHVDPYNRYRYYSEEQVEDARLINMLRGIDMPLHLIAGVLDCSGTERVDAIRAYWDGVEEEWSSRRHLAAYVVSTISTQRKITMSVQTTTLEPRTYLTERKRVSPEQIPGFIQASCERLMPLVEHYGGWAGPLTTIYHSEVNDDNDGEIENGIPVAAAVEPSEVSAPTHVLMEPACEVAYARITKAQVQFPQILQAYDEVYQWLDEQGFTPAARPREIYFGDFSVAGPNDEVCDIAVPFTR
ncbi:MerR family transcriptional regulator [Arthrobacter castelli]|uniref:MerR family transcriptional regulator n=1 Tax=Arthrobacter castelli TaxID=271431 RepID=UPI00041CF06C|nr:MerR family transcriptional regulator [Arthrobacter castelli]